MEKTLNTFLKIIGYAGYALMTVFAAMFAVVTLAAVYVMFTDCFAIGFLGTAAGVALTLVCWTIREDLLV